MSLCFRRFVKAPLYFYIHNFINIQNIFFLHKKVQKKMLKWFLNNQFKVGNQKSIKVT